VFQNDKKGIVVKKEHKNGQKRVPKRERGRVLECLRAESFWMCSLIEIQHRSKNYRIKFC
jgi:hypothetical protein